MERIVYDRMAELDSRHWWYRARRDILATLIARKIDLPAAPRILEIGCGTGHNLEMLQRFGRADGIEIDPAARALAAERLGRPIGDSPLPALAGVEDGAYDLVAILDVLEHVEEDRAALQSIARKLKAGGRILITVPAHPWMWSAHDVVNHHKRRYTRATLRAVIGAAGLKIEMMSWFNSLLFPLAAAARIAGRITRKEDSDDALPAKPVNSLFEAIFGLERYAVGRMPLPPGVSLVAIVSLG
ncbi:bifunctional 2-polyprenyl-6-hydroxyphenol methylase/3-demethylubiquinol 3-O-methyltransferase UbiG [Sphingosinicella sp. BN140058]|uniref:class I SAM-dependent methyltransferase n=1 Tax=Sphingosinicella sp. BN140058 TaxID=1892855 RepID=UPI0010130561|nr:class I SAM-dependent methyltransferase [Sphingosinicella sp. BN140058]QAY79876.1 class I SAM-dependent methyltransferase [Sphingosinicella sp. BN140058]